MTDRNWKPQAVIGIRHHRHHPSLGPSCSLSRSRSPHAVAVEVCGVLGEGERSHRRVCSQGLRRELAKIHIFIDSYSSSKKTSIETQDDTHDAITQYIHTHTEYRLVRYSIMKASSSIASSQIGIASMTVGLSRKTTGKLVRSSDSTTLREWNLLLSPRCTTARELVPR